MKENNRNSSDAIKTILNDIAGKSHSSGKNSSLNNHSGKNSDSSDRSTRVNFQTSGKTEARTTLSVPDKYQSGPKYNSTPEPQNTPRVNVAYVPKFTGASLNYRMIDDPRGKVAELDMKNQKKVSATAEYKEDVESISKDEKKSSASVMHTASPQNEQEKFESVSKVFKFEKSEPQATIEKTPVMQNAPAEETVEVDKAEIQQKQQAAVSPKEYKIPDPSDFQIEPEQHMVSSAIAASSVVEDSPSGIDGNADISKRANEYTSLSQRDSFKDRFIDTVMSVYVRFFAALILTVIVAVAESMFASGVDIPGILHLTGLPGAMALLDLQFVLCLYLLALPENILAIGCLARRKLIPELFLTASFVVLVVYTVVITACSPENYALFGFVFAIFVLAAISASYFKTMADFTAFKRTSKNGEKIIIDNTYTRNLEKENAALDGTVKEHKSRTARTFRTLFTSDFFGRSAVCAENSFNLLVMLGAALGLSIVVGAIAFFIPGGGVNAITAFTLVFMLSCPAVSLIIHKTPYFHASREAELENSAIIGEKALHLYSGIDVITFEDTEVFGEDDVTLQRIMLYGRSDNLTKALRQMAALFMNVGGPLDVLFSNSVDRKCAPAQSIKIEADGISGKIDGNTILSGNIDYILRHGAKLPAEELGVQENLNNSTKVMYVAENGAVYAKFYIRYSFSEEFTMILPTLDDAKIKPLVYTRDPNITNQLVSILTAGSDKIRVMRKNDTLNGEVVYRKASAGMMTNGDKANVVNMILLAKKYTDLQSYFGLVELISMVIGGLLATVLAIVGMADIPSLALSVFQISWCVVLHFISAVSFRFSKPRKR